LWFIVLKHIILYFSLDSWASSTISRPRLACRRRSLPSIILRCVTLDVRKQASSPLLSLRPDRIWSRRGSTPHCAGACSATLSDTQRKSVMLLSTFDCCPVAKSSQPSSRHCESASGNDLHALTLPSSSYPPFLEPGGDGSCPSSRLQPPGRRKPKRSWPASISLRGRPTAESERSSE
jgi:hypothetical protein